MLKMRALLTHRKVNSRDIYLDKLEDVHHSYIMDITVKQHGPNIHNGHLSLGKDRFPCALGRAGILANKKEGDGGTPAVSGKYRIAGFVLKNG